MPRLNSQRALAKALGVAPSTVAGYLKKSDWPVRKTPPWSGAHVSKIKTWRAALQEDRSGKGTPTAAASPEAAELAHLRAQTDAQLKFERMRKARVEADRAEGRVMDHDLHEAAVVAITRLYVQRVRELIESLPARLEGEHVHNAEVLRDAIDELCLGIIDTAVVELDRVDDEIAARVAGRRAARGRKGA